jgi:hypothetical protein
MQAEGIVKILLLTTIMAMAFLAVNYLRQRRMNFWAELAWTVLAVTMPVLGPFIVIAARPGRPSRRFG